jgi:hypothetical protein
MLLCAQGNTYMRRLQYCEVNDGIILPCAQGHTYYTYGQLPISEPDCPDNPPPQCYKPGSLTPPTHPPGPTSFVE